MKNALKNFDGVIAGAMMIVTILLVIVNVITRKLFNYIIIWSEEIATSCFVYSVFIGAAYAYRKHSHLGVDIVVNLMHGRTKAVVRDVMAIVELLILIMLTIISAQYVYNLIYVRGVFKPAVTDVLRIPKAYTGIAVPLGFGVSTLYSIYFLLTERFHIIKVKKKPEEDEGYQVEGGNY